MANAGIQVDPRDFLAKDGEGRTIGKYRKSQTLFAQGDAADSVFYIHKGKIKVSVLSRHGKEAVVAILGKDEFCGEACLAGQRRRISSATALTECEVMRIEADHPSRAPRRSGVLRDIRGAPRHAHDPC